MAAIDFPANPSVNDIVVLGGYSWIWNGEVWKKVLENEQLVAGTADNDLLSWDAATSAWVSDTQANTIGGYVSSAIANKQDVVTGVSDTEIGYLDGVTSGIQSQLNDRAISHNYIINGAFDFAQRGTTGTVFFAYGLDRWYLDGSNDYTQVAMTDTDRSQIGIEGYSYYMNYTNGTATASGYSRIEHRIEDVRTLAGQTVTISFWARNANAAKKPTISIIYQQNFGSGGSSNVEGTFATINTTTTWQRYQATVTIPSIVGKTIGTNSSLRILWLNNVGTTDDYDIDIWGVQLEAGSVATPFKRHAPSLQGELAACQRYYFRQTAATAFTQYAQGMAVSGTVYRGQFILPVAMRVPPTSLETASLEISDYSFGYSGGTFTIDTNLTNNLMAAITYTHTSSALSQFRPYFLKTTASGGYIGVNAEL